MDFLIDLSWRAYPAAMLIAMGLIVGLRGARTFIHGFDRPFDGPSRVLVGVRGFRRGIVGLAIAGIGAAWLWHIDWILVLSLAIGGEELLESTFHIQALSMAEKNKARRNRRDGAFSDDSAESAKPGGRRTTHPPAGPGLSAALVWTPSRRGPR
ncbi:MAG TPA: hypothetical protein QGF05_03220 [Dehalococcoidia bacterium]|nr:hypothetical protein [Dehalococcoidia bacterium]